MAAEVPHGPQAQAGGEHALEQRAGEGLPVETAGEAVLPRVAVEEAARSNDGAVNRPAIMKKRPSPNSQPVPSRIVMPAVTASGISS